MTAPGLMVMAVDNLPAEMAREASQYFGTALYPFVEQLVTWKPDCPPRPLALTTVNVSGTYPDRPLRLRATSRCRRRCSGP